MSHEIDVQLAVAESVLPQASEVMTADIVGWVRAVLATEQVAWQRPEEWLAPLSLHQAVQLTVRIVAVAEAAALNQDYRQSSGPTNVLSFPCAAAFQCQPPLLGDVVICATRVAEEAEQQDKPLLAHWAHLVVHGVLHLLGYDHLDDRQTQVMEGLEINILAQLGYLNPYQDKDGLPSIQQVGL